jgi:hypothetical protein
VVRSIEGVEGAKILLAPRPGSGEKFLTRAIEDAATLHRPEILPGVATVITGKLKDDTTPDAIMEALRSANLLEE